MKMKRMEIPIFATGAFTGSKYCIAPTMSMAMVTLPATIVIQPRMKEVNLPNACLAYS